MNKVVDLLPQRAGLPAGKGHSLTGHPLSLDPVGKEPREGRLAYSVWTLEDEKVASLRHVTPSTL